jgi:dolichyl-phosphate beta-glucosyltransferase
MLEANGQWRFICDADLSMPIQELPKFLPPRLDNYDVAIGSREGPGARRFNEPLYRHLIGRAFSTLVKIFAMPGFEDTQCGFKCFAGQAAQDLFAVQRFNGMSFDVEVLYIARKRGYKIVEVPIDWYFQAESKVRLLEDSARMLWDIVMIRRNWYGGKYQREEGRRKKEEGPN